MKKKSCYAQDGVDVKEGDSFSSFAAELCRSTYENSGFVTVRDFSKRHFRGPRAFRYKNLPRNYWIDASPDGDGTKPALEDAAGDYENAAHGIVAMTFGDISRWGGIAFLLLDNLDVRTLGKFGSPRNKAYRTMMLGLRRLANENRFVLYKGETAELPGSVTSPNRKALAKYLWSGVALGAYNPKTIITGDKVKEGMIVMALKERGFRNNGISSARKAIVMHYGSLSSPEAQDAVKRAAAPAILYDHFLTTANGWFEKGFKPVIPSYLNVHLTGGAIKSKLAEDILFPRGFSARLNNLWEPASIMRECADWRGMCDDECYEAWHGGQGWLSVINASDESAYVNMAADFGHQARRAGVITRQKNPTVVIESKFTGKTIEWFAK